MMQKEVTYALGKGVDSRCAGGSDERVCAWVLANSGDRSYLGY